MDGQTEIAEQQALDQQAHEASAATPVIFDLTLDGVECTWCSDFRCTRHSVEGCEACELRKKAADSKCSNSLTNGETTMSPIIATELVRQLLKTPGSDVYVRTVHGDLAVVRLIKEHGVPTLILDGGPEISKLPATEDNVVFDCSHTSDDHRDEIARLKDDNKRLITLNSQKEQELHALLKSRGQEKKHHAEEVAGLKQLAESPAREVVNELKKAADIIKADLDQCVSQYRTRLDLMSTQYSSHLDRVAAARTKLFIAIESLSEGRKEAEVDDSKDEDNPRLSEIAHRIAANMIATKTQSRSIHKLMGDYPDRTRFELRDAAKWSPNLEYDSYLDRVSLEQSCEKTSHVMPNVVYRIAAYLKGSSKPWQYASYLSYYLPFTRRDIIEAAKQSAQLNYDAAAERVSLAVAE